MRIPTVGPGARILRLHANPEVPVEVVHDGADNWFVRGAARVRVRLVMEIAIPRAAFGSDFADVGWGALSVGQTIPHLHDEAFQQVAQAVGISRAMRPREVVRKMVTYFRAFAPSDDPPSGNKDIYLDLALSKKGVCRHRAFAFLVTGLEIGIPTRMVVNEAHAWVEVFDGTLWHRIDLGGAAANLDHEADPAKPAYKPPPDPYAWPESRDSGQDLADRNRDKPQSGNSSGTASSGTSGGPADSDAGAPTPSASNSAGSVDPLSEPSDPKAPRSEVTVAAIDSDVRRGFPFHVQGSVATSGAPCSHLRVDVLLTSPQLQQGIVIGSLSTDDRGRFDGAVVIPRISRSATTIWSWPRSVTIAARRGGVGRAWWQALPASRFELGLLAHQALDLFGDLRLFAVLEADVEEADVAGLVDDEARRHRQERMPYFSEALWSLSQTMANLAWFSVANWVSCSSWWSRPRRRRRR